jgi:subtilisin
LFINNRRKVIDLLERFRTSDGEVNRIAKRIGGDTVTVRKVVFLSSLAVALSAQVVEIPAGNPNSQDYIVSFRAGTGPAERAQAVQQAGAQARFNYTIVDAAAVRVPNANVLAALQRHPQVESIVPDRPVYAVQNSTGKPVDLAKPGSGGGSSGSGETVPEGVKRIGAPHSGSDGTGIGVAILDTGIDYNHADLVVAGPKFDAFGGNCLDGHGHGTHVSGTVAAKQDNGTGVVGVAPNATLYCVKVLDNGGSGSDAGIIAGLDWVFKNPAIRVVNMSLGRLGSLNDNPALRTAVQKLYNAGVVVVVAAGNDPTKVVSQQVPATYPEVFAVASTTAIDGTEQCSFLSSPIKKDTASYFTTDGALNGQNIGVTISAPGEDAENVGRNCMISSVGILSLKAGGGTTRMSGTSMASPHVAGVVARIMQNGNSNVESIRTAIRTSATTGTAPLNSPTGSYTFDGEREGVVTAP